MGVSLMNGELGLAGQLTSEDIKQLAAEGIKTFVCNRPDGEGVDQPERKDLEEAARQSGAEFYYLPLTAGVSPDEVLLKQYAKIFQNAPKPVVAFCRTGRRSGMIHEAARQFMDQN
jgi:sulfide:quinone oxidoreductase